MMPPRLPPVLEPLDLATITLQHEDLITDFDVTDGSLEAASIDGLVLRTGHLRNVNLRGAVLERLELTDVCLTDCDRPMSNSARPAYIACNSSDVG